MSSGHDARTGFGWGKELGDVKISGSKKPEGGTLAEVGQHLGFVVAGSVENGRKFWRFVWVLGFAPN